MHCANLKPSNVSVGGTSGESKTVCLNELFSKFRGNASVEGSIGPRRRILLRSLDPFKLKYFSSKLFETSAAANSAIQQHVTESSDKTSNIM
jgi:hypothetical protein